jgi:S1-C subfamily serine protease
MGAVSMKKRILVFLSTLIMAFLLLGCDAFTLPPFFPTLSPQTTQAPRTIDISGTISIGTSDYLDYAEYRSPSYDLDVDPYNDVLINTRDEIRRANIKVQSTLYEIRNLYPFGSATVVNSISKGSGVIFKEDDDYYYAITNHHVIDPLTYTAQYEIMTFEDEEYQEAELVAYLEDLDLAVLRFEKNERTQIRLLNIVERSFTKISPGELVMAVGNPLSVSYNVTFGEFVEMVNLDDVDFEVLYHTAMIHEGSSGGALVDVDGNLLGINTWGSENTDEIAYAVPVSVVYMFLNNNDLLP